MKRILTILSLQFAMLFANAQSQSDSNYSFGFKLLSVEELPRMLNEVKSSSNFYYPKFNGLILKINDNQISYRFQISNYKNDDYSFTNECSTCETVTGKYTDLNVKLGFERSMTYSALQPFYGIDLGYRSTTFIGQSKDQSTSAPLYNADLEKNGALIYPFFGLKYTALKVITISAEAGLDSYDKEVKSNTSNTVQSVNNFKRWQYIAKPLGLLSLQFNFGEN
jgi:hypothetical protein